MNISLFVKNFNYFNNKFIKRSHIFCKLNHINKKFFFVNKSSSTCSTNAKQYQNLIIDLSYDDLMSSQECHRLARELYTVYNYNIKADAKSKYNINVCNQMGRDSLTMQYLRHYLPMFQDNIDYDVKCHNNRVHINGNFNNDSVEDVNFTKEKESVSNSNFHIHNTSYLNLFPPHKLVYLSPDSDNLLTYNYNDIYIIGGYVDKYCYKSKVPKSLSLDKALNHGLKTARLPIDDLINEKLSKRIILFIPQITFILSQVKCHGDWEFAIRMCLPEWKLKNNRFFNIGV